MVRELFIKIKIEASGTSYRANIAAGRKLMQAAEVRNPRRDRMGTRDGIGSINAARPPNYLSRERELRASLTTNPLEVERCNYYVAAVTQRGICLREPGSRYLFLS